MRITLKSIISIWMSLTLAAIVAASLTGCSKDAALMQPEPVLKVLSRTPDALMENFVKTYGERDLDTYAQLLHEQFIYTFNPETSRNLGPSYEYFTRQDELECAANLFSGEVVTNSRGQQVPAITAIEFRHWEQIGDWELASPDEVDGLRGVFECTIRFVRAGAGDLTVRGRQLFTVAMADVSDGEGAVGPYYQIIGWQDLTR